MRTSMAQVCGTSYDQWRAFCSQTSSSAGSRTAQQGTQQVSLSVVTQAYRPQHAARLQRNPLHRIENGSADTFACLALELYNIRTDAIGLLLLSLLTLMLSGVQVPFMKSTRAVSKAATSTTSSSTWQRAALVAIAGTIAHHIGTAVLAYGQWANTATTTGAMLLGWVYSGAISLLGFYALYEVSSAQASKGKGKTR